MTKSNITDVEAYLIAQTDRAILVNTDGPGNAGAVWLPKSKVEFDDVPEKTVTTVTIPEWLALDKGLI